MAELSEKQRDNLDEDQFAFPKERKEPLNNASHVRNAMARFDQVEGVSDDERDEAWSRIKKRRQEAWRRGQREELARAGEEVTASRSLDCNRRGEQLAAVCALRSARLLYASVRPIRGGVSGSQIHRLPGVSKRVRMHSRDLRGQQ